MALLEITKEGVERRPTATFAELGIRERDELQKLLRDDIGVIDEELLVIAEEFGDWEDARRRVDLLALDKDGHLVVIELKRTEDGGHMDLQALRYAAMVSLMVVEDVVKAYESFLATTNGDEGANARTRIAQHLGIEEEDLAISSEVRIVLISGDFGREITTAALWLNGFDGMDVRCIRLVPYRIEDRVLLDLQQIVPLPETADYQVRVRRKDQERERTRVDGRDFTKYRIVVDGEPREAENKRNAVRVMVSELIARDCPAERIAEILGPRKFRGVEGKPAGPDALTAPMAAAFPQFAFDPRRWYLDQPFYQGGRTWAVSKMWGRDTETVLTKLQEAFPDAGVGFVEAED